MYLRRCPGCKTPYEYGSVKCTKCGYLLIPTTTACRNPDCSEYGKPIPADIMKCPKCHMKTTAGEEVRKLLE